MRIFLKKDWEKFTQNAKRRTGREWEGTVKDAPYGSIEGSGGPSELRPTTEIVFRPTVKQFKFTSLGEKEEKRRKRVKFGEARKSENE